MSVYTVHFLTFLLFFHSLYWIHGMNFMKSPPKEKHALDYHKEPEDGDEIIAATNYHEDRDLRSPISFVDIAGREKTRREISPSEVDYVLQQCAKGEIRGHGESTILNYRPSCTGLIWMMDLQHIVRMRLVFSRRFKNDLEGTVLLDKIFPRGYLWDFKLSNEKNHAYCDATSTLAGPFKFAEIAKKYDKFSDLESHFVQLTRVYDKFFLPKQINFFFQERSTKLSE